MRRETASTATLGRHRALDLPAIEDRDAGAHNALTPATSFSTDSLASPKSIAVFGIDEERVVDPGEAGSSSIA